MQKTGCCTTADQIFSKLFKDHQKQEKPEHSHCQEEPKLTGWWDPNKDISLKQEKSELIDFNE